MTHNDIQIGNKENVIEANSIQSAGYKSIISTLLTAGVAIKQIFETVEGATEQFIQISPAGENPIYK